jgi:hypothetical protein
MSEKEPELIITDRRKFRSDGEPTGVVSAPTEFKSEPPPEPAKVVEMPNKDNKDSAPAARSVAADYAAATKEAAANEEASFTAPTDEQITATHSAYHASTRQLDDVIAAANPGTQSMAEMNFSRLVQSIYMTAMLQMGAVTQEGQQPRVDILGARQSVDMLGVLSEKSKGNLTADESNLLSTALFDLRMAFLEITQAIARNAAQQPGTPQPGPGPKR